MYVCLAVSWLTFLLKLHKYRDISRSGWDIFLKICGDIPGMLVHRLQINLNFLYVCQCVSWLTSLLKLDKCKDISSSEWNIILKFFGDIPGMLVNLFQINLIFFYVCQFFSWLTSLLKLYKYMDISTSGWDIFLNFFRQSWDVFPLVPNKLNFFVCLSVSFLHTSLLKLGSI